MLIHASKILHCNNKISNDCPSTYSLSLSLKDSLFTVSVNPSGRVIAGISLSGDLSLWDLPSCRLRTKWTTDELVYTQVLYEDHAIKCYLFYSFHLYKHSRQILRMQKVQ